MDREQIRRQILAAQHDRRPVPLEVEEWGVTVYVKYITVDDQIELSEHNTPQDMPIAVLLQCVTDENGERIFTEEDRTELSKEAFAVVLKVFVFAAKLNGLSTVELDAAMANFGSPRTEEAPTESDSRSGMPISETATLGS